MAPHLYAAVHIKRGILEVRVKHAARLAKTVGVVDQPRRRHNMEVLAIRAMTALRGGSVNSGNQLARSRPSALDISKS